MSQLDQGVGVGQEVALDSDFFPKVTQKRVDQDHLPGGGLGAGDIPEGVILSGLFLFPVSCSP
jgi:hypothetical protein